VINVINTYPNKRGSITGIIVKAINNRDNNIDSTYTVPIILSKFVTLLNKVDKYADKPVVNAIINVGMLMPNPDNEKFVSPALLWVNMNANMAIHTNDTMYNFLYSVS